jgi:hypothetical protein
LGKTIWLKLSGKSLQVMEICHKCMKLVSILAKIPFLEKYLLKYVKDAKFAAFGFIMEMKKVFAKCSFSKNKARERKYH